MNKEAVALAADSAVTLSTSTGPKVLPSANKIFELSARSPVGIMIYGGAEFLEMPWETAIKEFRAREGSRAHDRLEAYGDRFLRYLESDKLISTPDAQRRAVRRTLLAVYDQLLDDFLNAAAGLLESRRDLTEKDLRDGLQEMIQSSVGQWRAADRLPRVPDEHGKDVRNRYRGEIAAARRDIFEHLPLSRRAITLLNELAGLVFEKAVPAAAGQLPETGVVIAGFGTGELFPRLRHYRVAGVAAGRLRFEEEEPLEVSLGMRAIIAPFAQREMVDAFIQGLEPGYGVEARRATGDMIEELVTEALEDVALSDAKREEIKRAFAARQAEKESKLRDKLRDVRLQRNVWPILEVVNALPKDELAAMAESLVNLTSFKRKVSTAAETVGGPIDVAVISRGDGFVWIKRKHYFARELNPRYFTRLDEQHA